ncbi:MAG: hypothetical protein K0B02_05260 [DPANN group archaeon]|nr:hypothetical protein [DPANN group archaeon]
MRRWFYVFMILMLFGTSVYAESLSIEKAVDNTVVNVGETVNIFLKINNPFNQSLSFMVKDYNDIGGNIIDTQCQSAQINELSGVAEYMSLQAYAPGTYTLGKLKVKYTNLETGDVEIVESVEDISIEVVGVSNIQQTTTQVIVQCEFDETEDEEQQQQQQQQQQEEQQEEEKSMTEKLKESLDKMLEEQKKEQQAPAPEPNPMQDKLDSVKQRSKQDMSSVKQQLSDEKASIDKERMESLDKALSEDKDFQDMQESLEDKGYLLDEKNIEPTSGNDSEFSYDYKKPDGSKASIKGNIEDGSVNDLKKMSPEDEKELSEALENTDEFKELDESLKEDGYSLKYKEFDGLDKDNMSDFKYEYEGPNGETANITGKMDDFDPKDLAKLSDKDLSDISSALESDDDFLKKDAMLKNLNYTRSDLNAEPIKSNSTKFNVEYFKEENGTMSYANITGTADFSENSVEVDNLKVKGLENSYYKYILFLFVLSLILYYYHLSKRVSGSLEKSFFSVPINPSKEAIKMLKNAEKMYDKGDKKQAYIMVSKAVRFYILSESDTIDKVETHITSTEALKVVKSLMPEKLSVVRKCFSTCDLVKFAKYKPNTKDFNLILKYGFEIVE